MVKWSGRSLDCLADLRRVNRYLGGHRSLAKHLFPMVDH
jgi:hypothetical protein